MFSFFLNPWMLAGLAGLSLPVIAHLLSKRNYEVIHWGAMQFLELNPNLRRKMKLEELLLMLIRLLLIALVVFALSRPWMSGNLLGQVTAAQSRDVVIVIDGSYSMGWKGEAKTPQRKSIEAAAAFLSTLRSGDNVTVIDARDPLRVVSGPSSDHLDTKTAIEALPAPSGTSRMAESIQRAIQIISGGENSAREIVIFTDGQRLPWEVEDSLQWTRIDERIKSLPNKPRMWLVDVGGAGENATNQMLESPGLSRELAVPGYPLRVETILRRTGKGGGTVNRKVSFEIDGQNVAGKKQIVPVPTGGETSLLFEHSFLRPGSHVLSAVLEPDNLPGDDRIDLAVYVRPPPRVLLVDGHPNADPGRHETRFLKSALTPPRNPKPWVQAEVAGWRKWTTKKLEDYDVVVLANVPQVDAKAVEKLKEFVSAGGGLLFALGDQVKTAEYKKTLWEDGSGLLPALPEAVKKNEKDENKGQQIPDEGLAGSWLEMFRSEAGGGLTEARITQWWKVTPGKEPEGERLPDETVVTEPIELVRFSNGEPFLLSRKYGRGKVMLYTSALDADWGNLIAKEDFVPLLHETVFRLSTSGQQRNVAAGSPIVFPIPPKRNIDGFVFVGPDGEDRNARIIQVGAVTLVRLDDTALPGVYRFQHKENPRQHSIEYFTAQAGREESDLNPLTQEDRDFLIAKNPQTGEVRFRVVEGENLSSEMYADESRSELWRLLLFVFIGILIVEALMTRRMVQSGHADERYEDEAVVLPIAEGAAVAPQEKREPAETW